MKYTTFTSAVIHAGQASSAFSSLVTRRRVVTIRWFRDPHSPPPISSPLSSPFSDLVTVLVTRHHHPSLISAVITATTPSSTAITVPRCISSTHPVVISLHPHPRRHRLRSFTSRLYFSRHIPQKVIPYLTFRKSRFPNWIQPREREWGSNFLFPR